MKLKYPKTIKIASTTWKIVYEKESGAGSLDWSETLIKIGTKMGTLRTLENIIHEFKEIIQIEQSVRFDEIDNTTSYLFCYRHKEHTDLCSRLAGLLDNFIK